MKTFDEKLIQQRIESVACKELGLSPQVAKQVAFHMTDWLDDLSAFSNFCANPVSLSDEAAQKMLMNFLLHVPNHLAAATKLYTGGPVKDVFEIGALTDDE